jgi:hypothetical protein
MARAYLSGAPLMDCTLQYLPANIRLGRKSLPGTDTLAYYEDLLNMAVKVFYNIGPRLPEWSSALGIKRVESFLANK